MHEQTTHELVMMGNQPDYYTTRLLLWGPIDYCKGHNNYEPSMNLHVPTQNGTIAIVLLYHLHGL